MNNCDCKTKPAVRVVAGNDLTVEALLSVYDKDEGVYKPLDLSGATDVALRLAGTFSKVPGKNLSVSGAKVSALFPADSLKVGVYGVEITFTDSNGRGRAFERGLIGVVATSGEATVESSAEGDTGEGLNITVDVKTRTVRIGGSGSGVSDYSLLENRPKINDVTLDGNKTSEDLGLMPKDGAYTKEEVDEKLESLPSPYTKDEADGKFETAEHASDTYQTKDEAKVEKKSMTGLIMMLDASKVSTEPGKGLSTNDFTDEDKQKVANLEPFDCTEFFEMGKGDDCSQEWVSLEPALGQRRPLFTTADNIFGDVAYYPVIAATDQNFDSFNDYSPHAFLYAFGGDDEDLYKFVVNYVEIGPYSGDGPGYASIKDIGVIYLQPGLISGENIKTVNGQSLLGDGDITLTIPTKLSDLANDAGYAKKTELPTKTSQLTNDSGFLTEHQSLEGYAKTAELASVATSGRYEDLDGKPTIITSAEVQQMINTAVVSAINTEV